MKKGSFVVIEGSDGSGKGTQQKLLTDYFKKNHISHINVDFPRYYKNFFGAWIGRFLKGEFGGVDDIPPYLVMFPYAADRWQAKGEMENGLKDGKIVVSNRYTGSAAYQAAKLPTEKRVKFYEWSFEMEYEAFGIPREDLVIFLYVPYAVSQKLIESKSNRKYLGNGKKKDIHESNDKLMRGVEKEYLGLAKKMKHWIRIDCTKSGEILSKQEIHEKIVEVLKKKKIVK